MNNKWISLVSAALFAYALPCLGWAAEARLAGKVKVVQGHVALQGTSGQPRDAVVGMPVMEGDLITTGHNAEMHAEMEDGAYLAARPNSQIKIQAYTLTGTTQDRSWIELLKGGLRMVSGWIGKSHPAAYQLKTPVATIGIRGTDFEAHHLGNTDTTATEEMGTHLLVYEGATVLSTDVGEVDVGEGLAGYALSAGSQPALHDSVPGFMRKKRSKLDAITDEEAANIKAAIMAKLEARSLAKTGETLAERIERFRLENPDSTLSNREAMMRAARRAANRNGQGNGNGGNRGGGRR